MGAIDACGGRIPGKSRVVPGIEIKNINRFNITYNLASMASTTPATKWSSRVLAGLSFTGLSILIPALLVLRVTLTPTNKLYDETRTLLLFGPLYNHGSAMFPSLLFVTKLAFGVTIGCGQGSGTAQAIIILVVEVISALVTSMWLREYGSEYG
jgi:Transient receptor potential (TRP) ion channel